MVGSESGLVVDESPEAVAAGEIVQDLNGKF
jgi:hypothetical protein